MAVACKCDRCENFYEISQKDQVCVVAGYGSYFQDKIDLCPNCILELEHWLKGGKFSNGI